MTFTTTYRKCGCCSYQLHEYLFPYTDKTKTARDFTRCLSCKLCKGQCAVGGSRSVKNIHSLILHKPSLTATKTNSDIGGGLLPH